MTRSSGVVGIVLDRVANPFYGELVERLYLRLVEIGKYPMLLKFESGSLEAEMDAIEPIIQYRMDGCIIASAPLSSKATEVCARYRLPMVMINRVVRDHSCAVSCNNYKGGMTVGQLLADALHTRIAFVAGREDTSTSGDRESGLRQALKKVGLDLHGFARGHYTYEGGFAAARELLTGKRPPDSIFAANDIMALGVIDAVRDAGYTVPGDMSVIGIDDIQAARWHNYRLTTIAQPVDAMISRALALLVERMAYPDLKGEDMSVQAELRIRHSARLPGYALPVTERMTRTRRGRRAFARRARGALPPGGTRELGSRCARLNRRRRADRARRRGSGARAGPPVPGAPRSAQSRTAANSTRRS